MSHAIMLASNRKASSIWGRGNEENSVLGEGRRVHSEIYAGQRPNMSFFARDVLSLRMTEAGERAGPGARRRQILLDSIKLCVMSS